MRWPSLLPDLTLPTDPHQPTEESQLLRILHKFNPALAYKYIGIPLRRNFLQVCPCIEIHSVCHQYFQPHSFCFCSFDLIQNPGTKGSPAQRGSGSLASGSTVFRSWQDGTCSSGCTRLYYSERCCTSHPQRFFKFNALNYAEYHIPSWNWVRERIYSIIKISTVKIQYHYSGRFDSDNIWSRSVQPLSVGPLTFLHAIKINFSSNVYK